MIAQLEAFTTESLDDILKEERIKHLQSLWKHALSSSPSRYVAWIKFYFSIQCLYRSDETLKADLLEAFDKLGLPAWAKRDLGVVTTVLDVFAEKQGWPCRKRRMDCKNKLNRVELESMATIKITKPMDKFVDLHGVVHELQAGTILTIPKIQAEIFVKHGVAEVVRLRD